MTFLTCGFEKKTYMALKDKIFPQDNVLPSTCREPCQLLVKLGIEYKKIHGCKHDCILYINEYKDNEEFPVCKEKRYHMDVQLQFQIRFYNTCQLFLD